MEIRPKWLLTLCACFFLLLSNFSFAYAAGVNRTVRAGVFYMDGYHMKDQDGRFSGYGFDFLNLVSQYSHLNFEYAGYDRSWEDTVNMLRDGEIDVATSARKTPEREELFAFSNPIGTSNTVLSIHSSNDTIQYGNYSTYEGMRIGVLTGSSQNRYLEEFAEETGVSFETVGFQTADTLAEALQNGSIDAILTSDLRRTENEKTLEILATSNFYAIVRKEDTDLLAEINYAIDQMNIHNGDWSNVLYYQYYGNIYTEAAEFTERERKYIQDVVSGKKKITVTAMGDRKPYSYLENGELKGILPDYFAAVMDMTGLPYEIIVPEDYADYVRMVENNSVDVVIDQRMIPGDSNSTYDGFLSDSYMSTGMAQVTRKDFTGRIKTVALADVQEDLPIELGLTGAAETIRFASRDDTLKAVLNGTADAAFYYTYTAQQYVNGDHSDSLQFSIINNVPIDFRMYVRNSCDHELITILNKCITQMPEDIMSQLITQYTSYLPEDMSFLLYMKANPQVMVLTAALAAGAVILIVCLLMRSKWRQKILKATELANKQLEEQLSIVDALSRDYLNVYAVNAATAAAHIIKLKGYTPTGLERDSDKEFPYDAILQQYIRERVYPEDQEALIEALSLEQVMKHLSEMKEYSGTYRILTGGKIHYFQYTYVASNWEDYQKNKMFLAGFRNIDDIVKKELEQKAVLTEALAEAQHANAAKTTFLNNMSHDIRTPMNAIIGFTSLAVTHIDNTEQVREYLKKILTSSKHLLSLINDVLDMSRIESGKVKIEEVEASLPEILHDLKTIVQADVKAKQLEFFVDTLDVTNENIICDKLRLNQVLLNILSNAMKYTKPGGMVSVRIVQTNDAPPGYASFQFHVKDSGIGMSEKFLEHLFEPFEREQTATVSGIQGTGLGLAITKNIVDMMNGTISVSSKEGMGSEFVVSFQFRISGSPVSMEPLEHLRNLRALVADDDVHTCTSVSKMLSSVGLRPDWTTKGKEAVIRTEFAMEQNDPFTVFVIDWLLPDLNGIETVRQIRKIIGESAQIIILTAYDWTDIEDEAREAGVTAFCSKPLFLSELRNVLAAPGKVVEEAAEEDEAIRLLAGKKILLVEDNELNQEIALTVLEEAGFVVDAAGDGTEAVEIIKTCRPDAYDLILMDIQMPVMDGYTASRTIRGLADPAKAGIPIVAMTANAFEEDRQKAIEAGMNGHIPKPIDVPILMGTLKEILLQ